jgi:large subunit ribosomal protein L21
MYAVIKTGGKQYRVSQGDTIEVETLPGEEGAAVEIRDVLMLADGENVNVGAPFVEGACVEAKIISHGRGPKIKIVKFRRRKHYRKQQGHRQNFTQLQITNIVS